MRDVTRVICGAGPGSFTSLRIAGAIAKGIVMGGGARVDGLFAVSSLALIVAGRSDQLEPGRWLALLDAMRGERYAALYEVGAGGSVREIGRLGARAIGPREMVEAVPRARGVAVLLDDILTHGRVSLDTWEPDYGRLAEAQVKWEAAHGRPLAGDA